MPRGLTAVYRCPGCGAEAEGYWLAPEDQDDEVLPASQECSCGHVQVLPYPGYTFRTEAG